MCWVCACTYICGRFGAAGLEAAFAPRQRKPGNVCELRNEGTRAEDKGSVPVRRTDHERETQGTESRAQEDSNKHIVRIREADVVSFSHGNMSTGAR